MDSTNFQQAANSSLSTSSGKRKVGEESMTFIAKRARFYEFYNPHQNWSLPENIIHYISKNPSTVKAYQKIIQSCKYFFVQKPLLVAPPRQIKYFNVLYIWIGENAATRLQFVCFLFCFFAFKDVKL